MKYRFGTQTSIHVQLCDEQDCLNNKSHCIHWISICIYRISVCIYRILLFPKSVCVCQKQFLCRCPNLNWFHHVDKKQKNNALIVRATYDNWKAIKRWDILQFSVEFSKGVFCSLQLWFSGFPTQVFSGPSTQMFCFKTIFGIMQNLQKNEHGFDLPPTRPFISEKNLHSSLGRPLLKAKKKSKK